MKVILDTNVIISGIFFKGIPLKVLDAWKQKRYSLIISHEIFEEYKSVCAELHECFPKVEYESLLELISIQSKMSFSLALSQQMCKDPDDDKFIACALASKSKIIVTGDNLLLKLSGFSGIKIIKPKQFLTDFFPDMTL